jgi:hypothetical protein
MKRKTKSTESGSRDSGPKHMESETERSGSTNPFLRVIKGVGAFIGWAIEGWL